MSIFFQSFLFKPTRSSSNLTFRGAISLTASSWNSDYLYVPLSPDPNCVRHVVLLTFVSLPAFLCTLIPVDILCYCYLTCNIMPLFCVSYSTNLTAKRLYQPLVSDLCSPWSPLWLLRWSMLFLLCAQFILVVWATLIDFVLHFSLTAYILTLSSQQNFKFLEEGPYLNFFPLISW